MKVEGAIGLYGRVAVIRGVDTDPTLAELYVRTR